MQLWTSISKIWLFLLYYILFQSNRELTLKPLILRPTRHIANVTSLVLWVPKTNTKVSGVVEFIFLAFRVTRLPKTGKTAKKNGKFAWLTMWLTEVKIFFFGNSMYFYPRKPKMSSFLLSEVLFRSYREKIIKYLIAAVTAFDVRSILFSDFFV